MSLYPKIHGPFKRDMEQKTRPLIMGDWAKEEFCLLKDIPWVAQEKLDGTNIRVIFGSSHFRARIVSFGGRTDKAEIPRHLLLYLAETLTLDRMEQAFPEAAEQDFTVTLYGEGVGHKIQSGGKYVNGEERVEFVLFDVKIGRWWLKDEDVTGIAEKLGIRRAPMRGFGSLDILFGMVQEGLTSNFYDGFAEGLVAKPLIQLFDRKGDRIITKIKHCDFYGAGA